MHLRSRDAIFVCTAAAALVAASNLCSQGIKPQSRQTSATDLLDEAIRKMVRIPSVRYQSTETQNMALVRHTVKQMGGFGGGLLGPRDKSMSGTLHDGILHARLGGGSGEIVIRGRRTICGNSHGWKLQRTGSTSAFVFDPQLFFLALSQVPGSDRKVRGLATRKVKGGERRVVILSLAGEAAADLYRSGALPPVQSMMSTMMKQFAGMAAGAGGALGEPEVLIDLSIEIDPVTGYVYEIRSATYETSSVPGIAGILSGSGEEDEEKETEEKETGKKKTGRKARPGLPQRKLQRGQSRCGFLVRLSGHERPMLSELDAGARRLLGLPGKQAK